MASITLFHCFYLPYPKLVRYHPILGYHAIHPSSINSHWVYICIAQSASWISILWTWCESVEQHWSHLCESFALQLAPLSPLWSVCKRCMHPVFQLVSSGSSLQRNRIQPVWEKLTIIPFEVDPTLLPLLVVWWCANIARGTAEWRGGGRHLQGLSQLSCDGTVHREALLRAVFGHSQDSFSWIDSEGYVAAVRIPCEQKSLRSKQCYF